MYQDDIFDIGRSQQEHKENLRKRLWRLQEANLRIGPEKCPLFKQELRQYLGVVSWYRRFVSDIARIVKPVQRTARA